MAAEQPTKVAKLAPEQSPASASKAVETAVEKVKNTDNREAAPAKESAPATDAAAPSLTEKKVDLLQETKPEKAADAEKGDKTKETTKEAVVKTVTNGKKGEEKEEEKTEEKEDEPKEETVTDLGNGPVKFVVDTVKTAVGADPVK